jgi:hypothetical protein
MNDPITVTTAVKFRRWQAPNYAVQDIPRRPRHEGLVEAPKMHVNELAPQVLDALAKAWLSDLYDRAGQSNPWRRA